MYTETEFEKLIKSVETEFSAHLAEVETKFNLAKSETVPGSESLAKAEDGAKKPEPKEKDGKEQKPEPKEGEAKPEGKEAAPAAEAPAPGEAPAEAAPAAPAEAAPAAPGAAGHDYDAEDMEHMKKMYMSMSEAELKAHHDCIAELAKCGQMAQGAAPAAPAAQAAPAIQKGEITSHDEASGGQIAGAPVPHSVPGAKSPASKVEGVQMEKSENNAVELAKAETAAANAKAETLQKSLDMATQILTKLVERKAAPAGKAITSLEIVAKSEGSNEEKSLSKSEIDAKLLAKSVDQKLEKSDRDLINAYYLSGGSINSISHLLK